MKTKVLYSTEYIKAQWTVQELINYLSKFPPDYQVHMGAGELLQTSRIGVALYKQVKQVEIFAAKNNLINADEVKVSNYKEKCN